MNRRGMTLIELLVFLWLLGCVVGGAAWGGARSAWLVLPGVVGGFVLGLAVPIAVIWPLDVYCRRRWPARPPCFAGRCGADDYRDAFDDGRGRWTCACGDVYVDRDGRFLRLVRDDVELPYMRKDDRGRWTPDARRA